ncbi:MAG: alpha/beta hydrolase [Bacteroidetes bacterium]|nr:alpha/beta hydrolase [Bacteroidota bacterium]MDA1333886.1 alpha/beta hydrolase [Bacteroidota bacterium]
MHRYYLLIQYSRALGASLILLLVLQSVRAQEAVRSIELETEDGITIYGDLYEPENAEHPPLILAFHQGGGDGRGEYGPIIPRLLRAGYAVLSIDQRRGGNVFQGTNRTVAGLPDGIEYSYCDAYPDLKATLDYARTLGFGRIIAWGSSYSAALVIKLAAEFPSDIERVLAFSPASGDPMAGCEPREPASRLTLPALMVRPEKEAELEWVAADLDAFRNMGHEVYISPGGSHGSSILVEARTGASTEEAWDRVLSFLGSD